MSQFGPTNLPKEVSFSGGDGASLITTLPGGRKKLAEVLNKEFGNKIRFITSHATGRTQVILVPDSLPGQPTMEVSATKSSMMRPGTETMQISDFLRLVNRPDLLVYIRSASDPSTNRAPRRYKSTMPIDTGAIEPPTSTSTFSRAPSQMQTLSSPPVFEQSASSAPSYSGMTKSSMIERLVTQQFEIQELKKQLAQLLQLRAAEPKAPSRRQTHSLPPPQQQQQFTIDQMQEMMAMMKQATIPLSPKRGTQSIPLSPVQSQSYSFLPTSTSPRATSGTVTNGSARKSRLSPRTLMEASGYGQQF